MSTKLRRSSSGRLLLRALLFTLAAVSLSLWRTPTASAAIFTVSNTSDSGAGSLRQALLDANATAGDDTINFTVTGTINLASALPDISDNLTINGPGANLLTVRRDTGGKYRIFAINSGKRVTISGLTISNGNATFPVAPDIGGGIFNLGTLEINNSTISGNTAFIGGGIASADTLKITNSTISGNTAEVAGGIGITVGTSEITNSTISGNTARQLAGGIENAGDIMKINNSTISGNSTTGNGGGIQNSPAGFSPLEINNSTISGNTASSSGGGINNLGPLKITNTTISDNSASRDIRGGGGIFNNDALEINNSIIARNNAPADPDISGPIAAGDYNLIQNTSGWSFSSGGTHNITGTDPLLEVDISGKPLLKDNGGPTLTIALLCSSPAIDQGISNSLITDQRGQARTLDDPAIANATGGDGTDIGAFEQSCNQPPTANAGGPYTVLEGGTTTLNGSGSDPDSDPLTYTWDLDNNGSFETPGQNPTFSAVGRDGPSSQTVVLQVCDNKGACATSTATVDITNVPPTANGDLATTNEDTAVTVNVLANDTDVPADPLTVTSVDSPSTNGGTVVNNGNGTVSYTPAANFSGTDTFTYSISDGDGGTATATVTVTVNPVNDAPVNTVPGPQRTNRNTPLAFYAANGNPISISDVDAGAAPVRVTLTATNGTLTLGGTAGLSFTTGDGNNDATMTFTGTNAASNAALNGLLFNPTSNFSGAASLTITINDQGNSGAGGALSDSDTVPITVNPANDPDTADLALTLSDAPDPVVMGNNLTYTGTVTNGGPDAATTVTLFDQLPASVTFVSATASQGSCTLTGRDVTCAVGTLASSATATVTIVVTPTQARTIKNVADVASSQSDPNTANNGATAMTKVRSSP